MTEARIVKAKRKCCASKPRCKKCPVVCKRLVDAGYAERLTKRTYAIHAPKKAVKAARAKKPV